MFEKIILTQNHEKIKYYKLIKKANVLERKYLGRNFVGPNSIHMPNNLTSKELHVLTLTLSADYGVLVTMIEIM